MYLILDQKISLISRRCIGRTNVIIYETLTNLLRENALLVVSTSLAPPTFLLGGECH